MVEFEKQILKMNLSELQAYESTVSLTNRFFGVLAICLFFFMLVMSNWIISAIGMVGIYYIANLSVAADLVSTMIKLRMAELEDK